MKNTSLYPRMRTGLLRASIKRPTVSVKKVSGSRGRILGASRVFTLTRMFGKRLNKQGQDVGELLNNWSGKPFSGWKDRARNMLLDSVSKHTAHLGGYKPAFTKDYYKMVT